MNHLSKTTLTVFVLLSAILQANILDHTKTAPNKSEIHKMRNVDFIYMINLDQRPEKFNLCRSHLGLYGIYPYRFSAVNGWELSLEDINDIGVKFRPEMNGDFMGTSYLQKNLEPSHELLKNYGQTYFCHCTARGTIGIALSHISILKDAFDSGYETIWVMEDDIYIIQDPNILSDLIDKLDNLVGKNNWDILFTDMDIRDANNQYVPAYGAAQRPDCKIENDCFSRDKISDDFRKIGSRFGAHSMIIRRSGIEKLLNFFKTHQMFLPYDMDYVYPKDIKMFTVLNDVVTNTPKALSDNGSPGYLNKGK